MITFIILGVILIGIFILFKRIAERLSAQTDSSSDRMVEYKLKPLLTPAELAFYRELKKMVPPHLDISCKTRLEDIVHIYTAEFKDKAVERNKIKSRHIDFLIWSPADSKVICVIELDDQSHQTQKARIQDEFKDRIFRELKIKLFRKKVSGQYDLSEIEDYIDPL